MTQKPKEKIGDAEEYMEWFWRRKRLY